MAVDPFTEMIVAYKPLLDNFFQNFSDIGAKKSYRESMQELQQLQGERDNYFKYQSLNQKLANTPLEDQDVYDYKTDWDNDYIRERPDTELAGTNAYKKYNEYVKGLETTDESGETKLSQEPTQFFDWAKNDPEVMSELYNLGYLKTEPILKPQEVIRQNKFKKAGLSEEDKKFYDEYAAKNFNYEKFNSDILNMFYRNAPSMVSTGALGNSLAEIYGKSATGFMITPPTPQKVNVSFQDGYMVKYDDQGNLIGRTFVGEKKPEKKENPNNWTIAEDEKGELYYWADVQNEKTGNWEQVKRRPLNKTEKEEYLANLEKSKSSGRTSSRRSRGGSGTAKVTPNEAQWQGLIGSLSDMGIKGVNTPEEVKAYNELFQRAKELSQLSDAEIHAEINNFEKTGKTSKGVIEDASEIKKTSRERMDAVYWGYKVKGGQTLGAWVRTFNQASSEAQLDAWWDEFVRELDAAADKFELTDDEYNQILNDAKAQVDKYATQVSKSSGITKWSKQW